MMSKMVSQLALGETLAATATCIALVIFLSFFVCMILWTTRRDTRELYQSLGHMPLEDQIKSAVTNEVMS